MKIRGLLAILLSSFGLGGCYLFDAPRCSPFCANAAHSSSSLVSFLYPNGAAPPSVDTIPQLRVPLRVGLAFLPSQGESPFNGLGAAEKEQLLDRIRQRFQSRRFVSEITVIPDYYLANARGFAGLAGLQRLYSVDVVALVSYDQVSNSSDMKYRSLAYLTIVGAFLVNGTENQVTTLVDLAVVDPTTRSLILRAGGTSSQKVESTLVDRTHNVREASVGGYSAATDTMIEHFDLALTQFELSVRSGTARVAVVNRDGSARGGGGAINAGALAPLLLLLALRVATAHRARHQWRRRQFGGTGDAGADTGETADES
jgi:rhombotail lipoprotein